MSGRTPLSSSSQHYHHQNQHPSSANKQRSTKFMAANGAANIRCPTCGCLNFSTEATCEPCRQKTTSQSGSVSAVTSSSSIAKTQPVSPRTAILRKQAPVPQPRTGIVTGLRTGLPIDAYRSGGRRTSQLGAKITRDGESPASSQPVSAPESEQRPSNGSSSARGTELYQRVLDQQRESREAKRKADVNSSSSSNAADVDEKSDIVRLVGRASESTSASPTSSQRPAKRLRAATKMRGDVIDLISSSDENENEDEDDGDLVGDDSRSAQDGKAPDTEQPAVATTSAPKPPAETESSVPAVVSSSRSDTNANPVVSAQESSEAGRIPSSVNADVTPLPASGAAQPTQNHSAQETVISYENDGGVAPFRSCCFPSVEFDPLDFPAGDTAAASKIRARRSSGVNASAGSSQSSDVAEPAVQTAATDAPVPVRAVTAPVVATVSATPAPRVVIAAPAPAPFATATLVPVIRTPAAVPPVSQPQAKQPIAQIAPKSTPVPALAVTQPRVESPRPVQTPAPVTPSVAAPPVVSKAVVTEQVQPVGANASPASAPESVGSSRLKRTASGNCQDQAIELGDDDESLRQEEISSTHGELFKSRIFQSIEFDASDFSTVHDGLHVARRTKISAQSDVTEHTQQGTQAIGVTLQTRPPPTAHLASGPVAVPSAVPGSVSTMSSRPSPVKTSRSSSQAEPSTPSRQVNVVPMSPRESPIWSSAPNAPIQSVVTPSLPPQGIAGAQRPSLERAPVLQSAAQRVVPRPPTTPIVSYPVVTPVASKPAAPAPVALQPLTPPVAVKPATTAAPVAFQTPAYSFDSRPSATPVTSVSATAPMPTTAPPARPTPAATPNFSRPAFSPVTSSASPAPPVVSRSASTPAASRPTVAPAASMSTATPALSSRPAPAIPNASAPPTPPVVLKPTATTPLLAPSVPPSSNTSSTEALRVPTHTPHFAPAKPVTLSETTTLLLARKKVSQTAPPPAVSIRSSAPNSVASSVTSTATAPASQPQVAKVEVKSLHVAVKPVRVPKPPTLGACSADFMSFMKDFIDGDDDELMNDEEETRKLHLQLLEVVDLTSLTDSDDDSSDGYEFSEPPTPRTAAVSAIEAGLALPLGTGSVHGDQAGLASLNLQQPRPEPTTFVHSGPTGFFASGVVPTSQLTAAGGVLIAPKQLAVVPPRPRVARQMEPCVICEEKRWVRSMIHCQTCGKYYHKKCAKEYGDDKICWNCELDGMIDDSELTDSHRDDVVGMLSTLRPASSSSEEEDDDDDNEDMDDVTVFDAGTVRTSGEEEEGKKETDDEDGDDDDDEATTVAKQRKTSQFPGATTKSMQRWKAFLDVSTSTVEKSFHEVTKAITEELQSDGKAKYSKGFTTPEIFQAAISEVLDSYADLQDQLDREAREKSRGSVAGGETLGARAEAVAAVASETMNAVDTQAPRVILDLSGPEQQLPPQLSRVAEILDA